MNKTNIYVSVRTPEDQKRFLQIARKAKEPINPISEEHFENGHVSSVFYNISFTGTNWSRCGDYYVKEKTLITLDQLESMLCGKGEDANLSPEDMIKKEFGNEPCFSVNTRSGESVNLNRIIDIIKKHADQQTSSLRKELETEISILADLVKGRDLTIKQKDEEIEALKQWKKDYLSLWNPVDEYVRNSDMVKLGDSVSGKTLESLKSLTSYRELMGRMAQLFSLTYMDDITEQTRQNIDVLLDDYKKLQDEKQG